VVLGAVGPDRLDLPPEVTIVTNPRWADGQATSLQAAIRWAAEQGHRAVVVGLGDQPGLTASAWRSVAATGTTPVAVATYAGRRGHPIRLGSAVWPDLPTGGDVGARELLRDHPELVTEVPCEGDPVDVDTVEDLAGWQGRSRRRPRS
jgi:CTP:molybdopterin cytidylyltransferase MocA